MNPYTAARLAAGIESKSEAARRLGMPVTQLRKYENGTNKPGPDVIRKMVEVYRLTAGQVLGLEPLPARHLVDDFAAV
jgi:transcriptional regulator with XRE-family HTH domain